MAGLFNLAADRALHMSQPPPPKISIAIGIGQPLMGMAGGGGLSSVQKKMNIGGQPHKLAYINSDEASLLKQMGGLGEPVEGTRGVPAYIGVGDEAGISEDYDIGGHMGGGVDMGDMGTSDEYTTDFAAGERTGAGTAYDYGKGQVSTLDHVGDWLYDNLDIDTSARGISDFMIRDIGALTMGSLFGGLGSLVGYYGPDIMSALGIKSYEEEIDEARAKHDYAKAYALSKERDAHTAKQAKEEEEMAQLDTGLPEETKIKKILDVGEEEEGRWDKYYEDREDRDPYEGYEYILEDVYGPDWRDRLKEGII